MSQSRALLCLIVEELPVGQHVLLCKHLFVIGKTLLGEGVCVHDKGRDPLLLRVGKDRLPVRGDRVERDPLIPIRGISKAVRHLCKAVSDKGL